ncbi:MAG: hypothetical protein EOP18_06705 [Rhizobiaceae bacterium]|nr:MAG: hypothetical protein EOP18_06705 [Rhizobiaceae bacterium]
MTLKLSIAILAVSLASVMTTSANAQRLCSSTNDANCLQTYCGVTDGPGCQQKSQVVFSGNYQVTVGTNAAAEQKKPDGQLNNLTDLSRTLTACWTPPLADDAFPGMQMTTRFSLNREGQMIGKPRMTFATEAASKRVRDLYLDAIGKSLAACTPLALTKDFGNAIAGRPISFRIIDDRKLKSADLQR